MPWITGWVDRNNEWAFGGESIRWAGIVVVAMGGSLRIAPVLELGKRFSGLVAIQPGRGFIEVT
jgi:hypothetical protein